MRACADAGSFRSQETLEELRAEAEEQVLALKKELHENPAAASLRERARARSVVLMFALAHNLAREASLKKKQTG